MSVPKSGSSLPKSGIAAGAAAVVAAAALLVSKWEGVRYEVYLDPIGIPTSCYGHVGPENTPGRKFTKAECDALLQQDLAKANAILRKCVGRAMPATVESAYTSGVFNFGGGPVCTPGRTPREALRAGDWKRACAALDLYKYAGGRVFRGLVLRRADERKQCESGI